MKTVRAKHMSLASGPGDVNEVRAVRVWPEKLTPRKWEHQFGSGSEAVPAAHTVELNQSSKACWARSLAEGSDVPPVSALRAISPTTSAPNTFHARF